MNQSVNTESPRFGRSPMINDGIPEEEIDLAQYLGVLTQGWLMIVLSVIAVGLFAAAYAFVTDPLYQVDVMLQVEDKKGGLTDITDMSSLLEPSSSTDTEIEIIRSRYILGKVVHELNLEVNVIANLLPVVGGAVVRHNMDVRFLSSLIDITPYVFGGESVKIDRLDVDEEHLGRTLDLVVESSKHYRVEDEDGKVLVEGEVGKSSAAGGVSLFVSLMEAHSQARFHIKKEPWNVVVEKLQKNLMVSEKGKNTGILSIAYQSEKRDMAMKIVDAIAHAYLRQNVERKSEEASRALDFLEGQLPQVKQQMDEAETQLNNYRLQQGSVDIGIETQGILSQLVDIDGRLSTIDLKRAEMTERFQPQHPMMQALDKQSAKLQQEKQALTKRISALPETEQKILTLTRDVKVNTELYTALLDKSQELKVVKAGTIGNVRIIDLSVMPNNPIKPKKSLVVVLGLIFGLFVGVFLVLIRHSMRRGIEDPELIERQLGLSVFASIPHSEKQIGIARLLEKKSGVTAVLLAHENPGDLAIEGLRSMRTNLRFSLMDAKSNVVVLSGPSPNLGKSFVSSNLAYILADAGQKVLLIDGDMRKGHLHECFAMSRENGLSGWLAGHKNLKEIIHPTMHENLFIMPTGAVPPNPSELLMHDRFDELLNTVSKQYDIVLIDTPPVLAVTDAAIIGRRAGAFFVLLRSGQNHMREIKQTLRHIENAGIDISGVLLNDIMPKKGYGYGNYGYYYQYAYTKDKGK